MSELYHVQQLPLFPTRVCRQCTLELSLDAAHFEPVKSGFRGTCRKCRNKSSLEAYHRKPKEKKPRPPHSEETKRKIGLSSAGRKHTPESIEKINAAHARMTPEERSARSVNGGKASKPSRQGMKLSDEWRKNLSTSHLGHDCHLSNEQKQKNGVRFAEMNRTRTVHATRLPHRRAMSSENLRRAWREKPDQMFAAHRRKRGYMTSIEKKVWNIVEPLGFTYESIRVRSDQRWYFPDFACGNLIIEVLGSYWHTEEETSRRVAILESQGFKVLTLWDYEIGYSTKTHPELQGKIETWYKAVQA